MAARDLSPDTCAATPKSAPLVQHIANVSGGKDSDCIAILANERQQRTGCAVRYSFADTGHEHDWTYEHIDRLERLLGINVERIAQDFGPAMARRRERLPRQWSEAGVPAHLIDRALELLHPTGVAYLDLVLCKGMFAASVSMKFCTELLKVEPSEQQVTTPLLRAGTNVIQWLGIRADESKARADLDKHPAMERRRFMKFGTSLILYRPILAFTIDDVIALHRRHNIPLNPLYAEGFSRVGCFPCINERKEGLAIMARRFPEAFEKLRAWEALVNEVRVNRAKPEGLQDPATFFAGGKVPGMRINTIDDVAEWALTKHGGKQFNMFAGLIPDSNHFACTGGMGWCEAA